MTGRESLLDARPMHDLKCWQPFFRDVYEGRKTFEVRRNDRGYKVGDLLKLREWTGTGNSGLWCLVRVTYILDDAQQFGVREGFVVMGIALEGVRSKA